MSLSLKSELSPISAPSTFLQVCCDSPMRKWEWKHFAEERNNIQWVPIPCEVLCVVFYMMMSLLRILTVILRSSSQKSSSEDSLVLCNSGPCLACHHHPGTCQEYWLPLSCHSYHWKSLHFHKNSWKIYVKVGFYIIIVQIPQHQHRNADVAFINNSDNGSLDRCSDVVDEMTLPLRL